MVWKKKGRKRKLEKIRKRRTKKPKIKIKMSEWKKKILADHIKIKMVKIKK